MMFSECRWPMPAAMPFENATMSADVTLSSPCSLRYSEPPAANSMMMQMLGGAVMPSSSTTLVCGRRFFIVDASIWNVRSSRSNTEPLVSSSCSCLMATGASRHAPLYTTPNAPSPIFLRFVTSVPSMSGARCDATDARPPPPSLFRVAASCVFSVTSDTSPPEALPSLLWPSPSSESPAATPRSSSAPPPMAACSSSTLAAAAPVSSASLSLG
mmetsp:Transcript_50209/g.123388  ORF Transcript_50209/g.123388 Transcript_50209/m.123388 type:complete len:214 (-) Transcript_50209:26-667(-)